MTDFSSCRVMKADQSGQDIRISQNFRLPLCLIRKKRNYCTIYADENPQIYVDSYKSKEQICPLCNLTIQSMYSFGNCVHKFCISCFHFYVIYKIYRREKVYCPFSQCNEVLDPSKHISKTIPLPARQIYQKKIKRTKLKQGERLCIFQDCKAVLSSSQVSDLKQIICSSCKKEYCKNCFLPAHKDSCDSQQIKIYQQVLNLRRCVKCKQLNTSTEIELIKCVCGYQFCYMCQVQWKANHAHGQLQANWSKVGCITIIVLLTVLICSGVFGGITLYSIFEKNLWKDFLKK